ncbi:hypothetical protein [Klenkia brasiliensis]|uniref:Uncharacterized protein n=1 Tax=Klenkia brasiliensis TaxID=333142 RepID=A0A1G7WRK4_9ACTN|nr:hypothetical protein [Klenkia brasiliensis]SDG74597.1 hypothetical protein SAMN05660324_3477 [Klenkia brasiliensis]
MVAAVVVLVVVALVALLVRGLRRRRAGFYAVDPGASPGDARGAVNRHSWMLGGGGGGGG